MCQYHAQSNTPHSLPALSATSAKYPPLNTICSPLHTIQAETPNPGPPPTRNTLLVTCKCKSAVLAIEFLGQADGGELTKRRE